jgi:hypothetical protein
MTTSGFTQDVIALFQHAPIGRTLARHAIGLLQQEGSDPAETMRQGIVEALSTEMQAANPLVAQIVARALLEHVDWEQVVVAVATDEKLN